MKSGHNTPVMNTASPNDGPQSVVGYAEQVAQSSQLLLPSEFGHPAVYLVPLKEESVSKQQTFRSYCFGVPSGMYLPHHKVIMVVGATGSGKSTMINTMANYILGVKWEDNFRFKLVHERTEASVSQVHSQTQNVSSYTIHSNDHINVPYTLTIIDTPGFGDKSEIERDKAVDEQIREFFTHPVAHGVDHIDVVGFVVQSTQAQRHVFESILAIFGKNIGPNIFLLVTFCDGQSPKVLEVVQEAKLRFGSTFKFNNSALFASPGDGGMSFDSMFWQMGYKSMHEFFDSLDHLEPQSLTLTVEVLDERRYLEIALKGLQVQIQYAFELTKQLNNLIEMLEVHKRERQSNEDFEYEVDVRKVEKVPLQGKGATNCPNCLCTCHHPCTRTGGMYWCHAMTWGGNCTVCPGKCSSSDHVHEYFTYRWITVKEKHTYADIKQRYRDEQQSAQTCEEVIKKVDADRGKVDAAVSELIHESHRCNQRLEDIALIHTVGMKERIDMLIEMEETTKNEGWKKRVQSLEAAKQITVTDAAALGSAMLKKMWIKMCNKI